MNKFLKLAVIPVAFLIAGNTTSCTVAPKEIALITDVGDIDDGSFNQESWEAVKEYATANHKSYDFYRPFNDSDFARNCAVKQAVAKGAQVIVLPGFKFAPTCAACMNKYPDVHFLLIDSYVHNGNYTPIEPSNNVCCAGYLCEYSGFIAGYTIAQDLMKRDIEERGELFPNYGYGYVGGMASDGVYQFGFGYIQGICKAMADFCNDHNITNKPSVLFNYSYAGVFAQDDATAIKVKSWYSAEGENNIKVVFPCGGKLYQSVTEAAQYYNKHQPFYNDWMNNGGRTPRDAARWVGVDSDQYRGLTYDYDKKSIYTSALKGLNPTILHALEFHYAGEWEKRIGGMHPNTGISRQDSTGKWILGLSTIFGDYPDGDPDTPDPDSYVGIPLPEGEIDDSTIFRGYDNYTYGEFKKLYKDLSELSAIPVYGGGGTECEGYEGGNNPGDPSNMDNWKTKDGESFREKYMGNYPEDKITISVQ